MCLLRQKTILSVYGVIIICLFGVVDSIAHEKHYVGSIKCKNCHFDIYKGWRSTYHPYKFQKANTSTVIGDFYKNNKLVTSDLSATMSKREGKYYVKLNDLKGRVEKYQIKYVIGTFWKQLYVTEFPNGELHILPIMWIVQEKKWKKSKYWPKAIYQYKCSGCHNTGTKINYDMSTKTYKTKWADLGVACEACHGPGSEHVSATKEQKPFTIVNPARIPDPRRAAMVCGACHTRGNSPDGKYAYPYGYLPGDYLSFIFNEKPKLHPDDTSKANRQQYIDWKKSGHARAGVLCWDCHFVHQKGIANKAQTKLPGSKLCRSCHKVESRGAHGIHSVNNCIGCHMPALGKRAIKGDVHSHQFKVIPPNDSINAGGIDKQPNSCNSCHYHKKDDPKILQKILDKRLAKSDENF